MAQNVWILRNQVQITVYFVWYWYKFKKRSGFGLRIGSNPAKMATIGPKFAFFPFKLSEIKESLLKVAKMQRNIYFQSEVPRWSPVKKQSEEG